MPTSQGFLRWLDEHDPEVALVVRRKRAMRSPAALRPQERPGTDAKIDVMRDRARDLSDPED